MSKRDFPLSTAEKRFRRRLRSKKKRLERQRQAQYNIEHNLIFLTTHSSYDLRIPAPKIFSFTQNRDEVLKFISKLEKALNGTKSVFVKLNYIETIDLEAITLLLGIMAEFKSSGLPFNGDFPDNQFAKKVLIDSGFLKQLYPNNSAYSFGKKSGIYTHGNMVYDEHLTCDELSDALSCVFGEKRRSQGARRVLLEAMKNTLVHASLNRNRHWWLTFKEDHKNKKLTVSMLDYGIGIFTSLASSDKSEPGYKWYERKMNLGFTNQGILKRIMEGDLRAISRTRDSKHGTGLPGMKTAFDNKFINRLVIMSNNVFADVSAGKYESLNFNFSGTLIQFEITSTCKSFPYE